MGSELSGAGGRVSERDLEVLGFVARFGVVPRGAVALWAGTAKTMTARRERRLREAGLLEVHRSLWPGEPVLIATAEGIAASSFYELFKAKLSPASIRHFGIAAYLAATLERDGERLLSERELLAHERALDERNFSLELPGNHHHRPDMIALPPAIAGGSGWDSERTAGHLADSAAAVSDRAAQGGDGVNPPGDDDDGPSQAAGTRAKPGPDRSRWPGASASPPGGSGRAASPREQASQSDFFAPREGGEAFLPEQLPTCIELELTVKGNDRLDRILTGWKEAVDSGRFARIRYFCAPAVLGPVLRAAARTDALLAVDVLPLPAEDLLPSRF